MPIHYLWRKDLSKYTLKSFDSANEVVCDTNNSDLMTYDANGTNLVVVDTTSAQTLTNKTLTAPTITAATLSGATAIGAGATIGPNAIDADWKVLAASATFTSNTVLASLTGMSWTVTAGGTYVFEAEIPITCTANGGVSLAFKYTTASLTSIQVDTYVATATDNATAVSSQSTTTTDQTRFVDTSTAAYTIAKLKGSMVVNAGGTIALQAAQHASSTDTTTILLGGFMRLTRVL